MNAKIRIGLSVAMVSAMAGLNACSSSAKVEQHGSTGQELIDLQEAYDRGLITEQDYQKRRKAILNRK